MKIVTIRNELGWSTFVEGDTEHKYPYSGFSRFSASSSVKAFLAMLMRLKSKKSQLE
jgi:hypothetical protein